MAIANFQVIILGLPCKDRGKSGVSCNLQSLAKFLNTHITFKRLGWQIKDHQLIPGLCKRIFPVLLPISQTLWKTLHFTGTKMYFFCSVRIKQKWSIETNPTMFTKFWVLPNYTDWYREVLVGIHSQVLVGTHREVLACTYARFWLGHTVRFWLVHIARFWLVHIARYWLGHINRIWMVPLKDLISNQIWVLDIGSLKKCVLCKGSGKGDENLA